MKQSGTPPELEALSQSAEPSVPTLQKFVLVLTVGEDSQYHVAEPLVPNVFTLALLLVNSAYCFCTAASVDALCVIDPNISYSVGNQILSADCNVGGFLTPYTSTNVFT